MAQDEALACRRELGAELRKRREAAGVTGLELAHQVGWSPSRVSRVESGHLGLSEVDLIHYLAFCGVYPRDHGDLLAMCRQAERKLGYWLSPHGEWLEDTARSLIYHEATASSSICYEPQLVPGLLQTESYIRALTAQRWPEYNADRAVRIRMDRQRVLHRLFPARFMFFVHEHALRLAVGGQAVMYEQLLALLLLDVLPQVTIRVVPANAKATFGGAFLQLECAHHQPLIYLDGYIGGLFLDDKEYVGAYRQLVSVIADVALDGGQSREFIAALANEHDRGSAVDHVEEKQL